MFNLSDEDHEKIVAIFKKNNPQLAGDPAGIREKIAEFDAEMKQLLEEKESGFEIAIQVYWQARNAFARFVGDEEIPLPVEAEPEIEVEPEPEAIEAKHVAVFIPRNGTLRADFEQSLGLFKESIWFKGYSDMREILGDVQDGKICGIIAIHLEKNLKIEGHVRHELKNLPGWGFNRAQEFVLPPCQDFTVPHQLVEVVKTIQQMQSGKFGVQADEEEFDLGLSMPSLISKGFVPKKTVRVVTIDDTHAEVGGIRQIMKAWHRVDSYYVNPSEGLDVEMTARECEVILLDESMGDLTGTDVQKQLSEHGFKGVVVSITGGSTPEWTKDHFQGKASVKDSRASSEEFVRFLSRILRRVGG